MKNFFKRIFLKFRLMDTLTKVFFVVFILLAIVTAVVAFNSVRSLTSSMTILDLPGAPVLQNLIKGGEEDSGGASTANPRLPH